MHLGTNSQQQFFKKSDLDQMLFFSCRAALGSFEDFFVWLGFFRSCNNLYIKSSERYRLLLISFKCWYNQACLEATCM